MLEAEMEAEMEAETEAETEAGTEAETEAEMEAETERGNKYSALHPYESVVRRMTGQRVLIDVDRSLESGSCYYTQYRHELSADWPGVPVEGMPLDFTD
jgi:hypothetical protein